MKRHQYQQKKHNQARDIFSAGLNALSNNELDKALNLIGQANIDNPNNPQILFTLGNIYLAKKEINNAEKMLLEANRFYPNHTHILNNLSNIDIEKKNFLRAIKRIKKALQLNPNFGEAWNTLGNIYLKQKMFERAKESFLEAIKVDANLIASYINLGNTLLENNELNIALKYFHKAIKKKKNNSPAYNGIGLTLNAMGKIKYAYKAYKKAISIEPKNVNALGNLATLLQQNNDSDEALHIYRDAISIEPDNFDLLLNLGHTLQSLGRQDEAAEIFEKSIYKGGIRQNILPYLHHAKMHICDWKNYQENVREIINIANIQDSDATISPFILAGIDSSANTKLITAKKSSLKATINNKLNFSFSKCKAKSNKTKLRIGYVSPDFRGHSLGETFEPILDAHNKEDFIIHGYSSYKKEDLLQNKIKNHFDIYRDISNFNTNKAAKIIYDDQIDILVDLAGHTKGSNLSLFSLKPAPVQAHYLGYGATIGAKYIPWLISDPIHTPPELYDYCSESIVLLPNSFMIAKKYRYEGIRKLKKHYKLPENKIIFTNFNSTYKFEPKGFSCWMKILDNCPNSVFWIRANSELAISNICSEVERHGINPNRIIFADRVEKSEHIHRLSLADIALDTFFHNGGVTTIDALSAGVPVISLAGLSHSERTGASILLAAKLPELVASSSENYIQLATNLGNSPDKIKKYKKHIASNIFSTPLFCINKHVKNLEKAYSEMYECFQKNEKPKILKI
ncbi:tetratricopeptide repeat protein [Alphaproteobacteria bacterium]|nr:tetratricopeptide repeat protein [Alphaproteobacteria bacterium]